jgi:hypothetical protein
VFRGKMLTPGQRCGNGRNDAANICWGQLADRLSGVKGHALIRIEEEGRSLRFLSARIVNKNLES